MPYVESGQLAGAISVLYNDGVEEVACVGYSDLAAGRKITMDDVFMQCSQTKGFCGVTMAKLVEEGKVSLDDPVPHVSHQYRQCAIDILAFLRQFNKRIDAKGMA